MNSEYDLILAAEALEQVAREREGKKLAGVQLSSLTGPKSLRVVLKKEDINEQEEVVWHVQGIIQKHELPPFTTNMRKAIDNTVYLFTEFSRCVGASDLKPIAFLEQGKDGPCLDLSNRYFTPRSDDPYGSSIPMDTAIDPTGTELFHGEDNEVKYFERKRSKESGKYSLEAISPIRLRVGDIVECQTTFMLVPVKGKQWKMTAVLRSITLLHASFTQVRRFELSG
ncbi:hypothetical protein BKA70DRAFT_1375752 [Coprinopsis sp. MPI-PUGE-AT-0042]|nr:hypothetical protein BKA70DRAFT_1375752 [Coprinopsis sp. MPI-PUGE-AT-0042]